MLPREHGIGISRGRKKPDPASPELRLGAAPSGGMESRILQPLPTIPSWKKQRHAVLPRNCRAACQKTRAGAEPDNFGAGDNFTSEPE
ncbi:hypothetical protein DV515_00015664, partial [Chloebia gouldiae]